MLAHVRYFCSRGASVCVHMSGIFVVGVRAIAFLRLKCLCQRAVFSVSTAGKSNSVVSTARLFNAVHVFPIRHVVLLC